MLAVKWNSDDCQNINTWAQFMGLNPKRLVALERKFLQALGYTMQVLNVEEWWNNTLSHLSAYCDEALAVTQTETRMQQEVGEPFNHSRIFLEGGLLKEKMRQCKINSVLDDKITD